MTPWEAARPLLAIGVPARILRVEAAGGPTDADWAWLVAYAARLETDSESLVAPIADARRRVERRDTASMFADLVRCLALLAFLPGGVTFEDLHFEVQAIGGERG